MEEDKDKKGNDVHIKFAVPDLAARILQRAAEEKRVVSIPSLGIELHPVEPDSANEERQTDPVKSTVSLLAAAVLEKALFSGQTVEIPSLGVKIQAIQSDEKNKNMGKGGL